MRQRIWTILCKIAIALPLLVAAQYAGHAQTYNSAPVTVSKEKVRVGGKICYSHIVLEKQTLYSISKAYGVSIEDIYQYNPAVRENGLKKNSIIIIPSREALNESNTPKAVDKKTEVKKPEEAKKEEAPVIVPESLKSPKTERQIALDSLTRTTPAENAKGQKVHVRKWYEDLDMIAEMYGVSVESLMTANKLTGRKLSKRQRLIIPAKEILADKPVLQQEKSDEHARTQQITEQKQSSAETEAPEQELTGKTQAEDIYLFPKEEVHATVLLPMRNAEGRLSRNNMDFYSGLMLAIYDLAQEGISTDINVYDLSDHSTPLTTEDIEGSDMIIGPISTADLTRLFQASPGGTSPVISPLDPRAERLIATHRNMIQVPTPHKAQYQDLVNWIKEDMGEQDKVFMFSERIARSNDAVTAMKEVMDSSGIEYTPFAYSILEGRDIIEPLKGMMSPEGVNRIHIASESEAFVNDVVRNLNLMLVENFQVVLYAPSKIRSFDTIEVEHFHKTSMHVSLTYFINYEDLAVKNFLLKYRALYNTEPTQFAFQGYDIGKYFISLCHKYGKRWPEKLNESEAAMLQSTFRCLKQGHGGYVNNGVRRIVYEKGWTIRQVQ